MSGGEQRAGRSEDVKLLALLTLICAALFALGIAVPSLSGRESPSTTFALNDLSEAHIVEIRDHRGAALLTGEFRSRVDALGNTERDAELKDARNQRVIGEVELETPAPDRPNRRPELEVDIMGLPAGQRFTVVIDDRTIATFATDDRGSVDLELQEGELPQ